MIQTNPPFNIPVTELATAFSGSSAEPYTAQTLRSGLGQKSHDYHCQNQLPK